MFFPTEATLKLHADHGHTGRSRKKRLGCKFCREAFTSSEVSRVSVKRSQANSLAS